MTWDGQDRQEVRRLTNVWKQNCRLPDKSGASRTSPVWSGPDKSSVDRTSPVLDSFEPKHHKLPNLNKNKVWKGSNIT
jgi:hypothetical protein